MFEDQKQRENMELKQIFT